MKNAGSEGYIDPNKGNNNGETYNTSTEANQTETSIVLWNLVFIIIGTGIILIVNYMQNKKLEEKLDDIMFQLKKQKKAKKED